MCCDMEVGQSKAHVRLARALSRRQPVATDRSGVVSGLSSLRSVIKSAFGASHPELEVGRVGQRLDHSSVGVLGVGEFPSIRVRRCAPRSDCWASVGSVGWLVALLPASSRSR
jgi:hypothetical protein